MNGVRLVQSFPGVARGGRRYLSMAPKESTQFTRTNNPARAGLEPNEKEVSWKDIRPISFRPFAEDIERLRAMKDRSGFIREAVHRALQEQG